MIELEHVNYSVPDARKTAQWMHRVFGWKTRWEGPSMDEGYTVHVGTDERYLALYSPPKIEPSKQENYSQIGGLNHIAVVVANLDKVRERITAEGFQLGSHFDYEPGERFYFFDTDGIEYEVVCYA